MSNDNELTPEAEVMLRQAFHEATYDSTRDVINSLLRFCGKEVERHLSETATKSDAATGASNQ